MQCKERLEVYLREHQAPYMLQHHAQAFTAQKIAESEHIPGKMVAKTVIVLADNQLIALVLPASYQVDLNKVQAILGARDIRLAHESEFVNVFPDVKSALCPLWQSVWHCGLRGEEFDRSRDDGLPCWYLHGYDESQVFRL